MKKALSIKRLLRSFSYAFNGIRLAFIHEANMKIHVLISILVIIFGLIFKISYVEWIFLILAIFLTIGAEVLNTSLENMVDLVIQKEDNRAKIIKDTAAAFVLVLAIMSAIIGLIIFVPKIFCL